MKKLKMRDGLVQRGEGRWTTFIHMGYGEPDPVTGKRRLLQKWVSLGRCTRAQAKAKRDELLVALRKGEFVEPSKATVGEWLTTWLSESVKPARRPSTYDHYKSTIERHITPAIGHLPLQGLRPGHLKKYYAERKETLAGGTLQVHHAIVSAALKSAVRQGLLTRNVASLVDGRPKAKSSREDAKAHCWSLDEARTFLKAARESGPQLAAFFALALDSGMRKGELCALRWSDVNLDAARVTVDRTLLKPGAEPVFGPTKNGDPRTIDVNADTVTLLREHKRAQAELRMRNRTAYHNLGLVFAKEWGDLHGRKDSLGLPLQSNNLGERQFARVTKAADVRRIKFHGLRHTCATLLLASGEPVHVVSQRLGHKNPIVTMTIYAHVLPSMQAQAAQRLGALLHG